MAALLSVEEAATAQGCSQETIRRAIRRKELLATRHPTKSGRPYQIARPDLKAWLDKRTVSG